MGANKPLSINQSSDRIGGGGCWRRNEIRNGGGGEGENADGYKLLNDRRCERQLLDKFNSRYS